MCSPVCDEAYGSLEVPENTPVGTPLKDVKCKTSDKEGGELRYAIKSGNVHGKFGINSTSSVGTVYVYQAISFESRTVSFQVRKLIKYCSSTAKTSAYNSYSTELGKKNAREKQYRVHIVVFTKSCVLYNIKSMLLCLL